MSHDRKQPRPRTAYERALPLFEAARRDRPPSDGRTPYERALPLFEAAREARRST